MRIVGVEAIGIDIAEPSERELAYGKISTRLNVLVRMEDESGRIGVGESTPIPARQGCDETQETVLEVVNSNLAALCLDQDAEDISGLASRIDRNISGFPYAKGCVLDAAHDLWGQVSGQPLWRLLGGRYREYLQASWSIAFKEDPADAALEARWAKDQGYRWLKVKIGHGADIDIETVMSVREAVGPEFPFHVDANAALSYSEALPLLLRLEKYNPALIEQPVDNLSDMAKLRQKLNVPLMADESACSPRDVMEIFEQRAADAILMKVVKHGGIRNSLAVARIAETAGLAIYPGTHLSTSVAAAASAHVYAGIKSLLPGDFAFGPTLLEHDVVVQPVRPRHGRVDLPNGPGLGIEIDDSLVQKAESRYRMRRGHSSRPALGHPWQPQ